MGYGMATGDTFEGALLEELGFVNDAKAYTGWLYDRANVAALEPDVIFADTSISPPGPPPGNGSVLHPGREPSRTGAAFPPRRRGSRSSCSPLPHEKKGEMGGNLGQGGGSQKPSSSSQTADPDWPVRIGETDIPSAPQKVVSLSPGATEMLFAMGLVLAQLLQGLGPFQHQHRDLQLLEADQVLFGELCRGHHQVRPLGTGR